MYIFIDCETTGLPMNSKAPITDLNNWPRVVQLAWARYDSKHRHLETKSQIIKPEGFKIPRDAQRIHGISTSKALAHGRPLKSVLKGLAQAATEADIVVAHNLRFDENIISAEFLRLGLTPPFGRKHRICTMIETTDFCRLIGAYGYKWPTLGELYFELFDEELEEVHDAGADVLACAKCFFELKKRGVVKKFGVKAK
ncbi:MAG TPA: 3'-5' exonuclease [Thermodesulfobacteriota bacterium]|nr:3'-5' exonuclease [Thermodesulfobacteriota bacterium]